MFMKSFFQPVFNSLHSVGCHGSFCSWATRSKRSRIRIRIRPQTARIRIRIAGTESDESESESESEANQCSDSQPCLPPFPRSYWHTPLALQRVTPSPRRSWFSLLWLTPADSSFRPPVWYGPHFICLLPFLIAEAVALTPENLL